MIARGQSNKTKICLVSYYAVMACFYIAINMTKALAIGGVTNQKSYTQNQMENTPKMMVNEHSVVQASIIIHSPHPIPYDENNDDLLPTAESHCIVNLDELTASHSDEEHIHLEQFVILQWENRTLGKSNLSFIIPLHPNNARTFIISLFQVPTGGKYRLMTRRLVSVHAINTMVRDQGSPIIDVELQGILRDDMTNSTVLPVQNSLWHWNVCAILAIIIILFRFCCLHLRQSERHFHVENEEESKSANVVDEIVSTSDEEFKLSDEISHGSSLSCESWYSEDMEETEGDKMNIIISPPAIVRCHSDSLLISNILDKDVLQESPLLSNHAYHHNSNMGGVGVVSKLASPIYRKKNFDLFQKKITGRCEIATLIDHSAMALPRPTLEKSESLDSSSFDKKQCKPELLVKSRHSHTPQPEEPRVAEQPMSQNLRGNGHISENQDDKDIPSHHNNLRTTLKKQGSISVDHRHLLDNAALGTVQNKPYNLKEVSGKINGGILVIETPISRPGELNERAESRNSIDYRTNNLYLDSHDQDSTNLDVRVTETEIPRIRGSDHFDELSKKDNDILVEKTLIHKSREIRGKEVSCHKINEDYTEFPAQYFHLRSQVQRNGRQKLDSMGTISDPGKDDNSNFLKKNDVFAVAEFSNPKSRVIKNEKEHPKDNEDCMHFKKKHQHLHGQFQDRDNASSGACATNPHEKELDNLDKKIPKAIGKVSENKIGTPRGNEKKEIARQKDEYDINPTAKDIHVQSKVQDNATTEARAMEPLQNQGSNQLNELEEQNSAIVADLTVKPRQRKINENEETHINEVVDCINSNASHLQSLCKIQGKAMQKRQFIETPQNQEIDYYNGIKKNDSANLLEKTSIHIIKYSKEGGRGEREASHKEEGCTSGEDSQFQIRDNASRAVSITEVPQNEESKLENYVGRKNSIIVVDDTLIHEQKDREEEETYCNVEHGINCNAKEDSQSHVRSNASGEEYKMPTKNENQSKNELAKTNSKIVVEKTPAPKMKERKEQECFDSDAILSQSRAQGNTRIEEYEIKRYQDQGNNIGEKMPKKSATTLADKILLFQQKGKQIRDPIDFIAGCSQDQDQVSRNLEEDDMDDNLGIQNTEGTNDTVENCDIKKTLHVDKIHKIANKIDPLEAQIQDRHLTDPKSDLDNMCLHEEVEDTGVPNGGNIAHQNFVESLQNEGQKENITKAAKISNLRGILVQSVDSMQSKSPVKNLITELNTVSEYKSQPFKCSKKKNITHKNEAHFRNKAKNQTDNCLVKSRGKMEQNHRTFALEVADYEVSESGVEVRRGKSIDLLATEQIKAMPLISKSNTYQVPTPPLLQTNYNKNWRSLQMSRTIPKHKTKNDRAKLTTEINSLSSSYVSTLPPDSEVSTISIDKNDEGVNDPFEFAVCSEESDGRNHKPNTKHWSRKRKLEEKDTTIPTIRHFPHSGEVITFETSEGGGSSLISKRKRRRQGANFVVPDTTSSLEVLTQTFNEPVWQYGKNHISSEPSGQKMNQISFQKHQKYKGIVNECTPPKSIEVPQIRRSTRIKIRAGGDSSELYSKLTPAKN